MKNLYYLLLFFAAGLCTTACSDDKEEEPLDGISPGLIFSPKEADIPAEGGKMEFVLKTPKLTCGYIRTIEDFTFNPSLSYYAWFYLEDVIKEYPFYPYKWNGHAKHDFGWFVAGISDDEKSVLVEVKPNTESQERRFTINLARDNSGGRIEVRQAGKR